MNLLQKLVRTLVVMGYMNFYGVLYTILSPLAKKRNEALKNKARQLNIEAAKNLGCGANSVFVKLASGIKLHVVEAGDRNAKLIVLLHGFPDCWHCWSKIIPELVKEGYFVVAVDMKGYNLSDKPQEVKDYKAEVLAKDIKELVDVYEKKTATVLAHDWGGIVGWEFAERYPEMVEKFIVLNAPHARAYKRELYSNFRQVLGTWYFFWFQIPYLAQNFVTYNPLKSVNGFFKTFNRSALTDEGKELLACSYVQDGALPAMLNYYKALLRRLVTEVLRFREKKMGKVTVPTLILWGENDVALVPELAKCTEFVENVSVVYIPNCSHWVPYEVPEVVSREVIKFLRSQSHPQFHSQSQSPPELTSKY
eukprot:Phypoly_transcript_09712.p1 GENE.Phypoly_transcript_09712~~Phypoly_transcript_09712.p1  ORF type:complete len:365 (+),score=46.79 Phypoly_transcript_09712:94-1188(+)